MTGLVDALPEVQALAARREQVNHDREVYLAWAAEQGERYREAVDRYQEQMAEAIRKGKPAPATRPPEPVDDAYHAEAVAAFTARDAAIMDERQRVLAAHATEVEEQARERLADLLTRAAPHVAALTGLAREVGHLRGDVTSVRVAVADRAVSYDSQHGGSRPPPFAAMTAADVVAAVLQPHQVDLLEATPPAPIGMVITGTGPPPPKGLEPRHTQQPQRPIRRFGPASRYG